MICIIFATMKGRLEKYLITLVLALSPLAAVCQSPDVSYVGQPVDMLKYHLRLRPDKTRPAECEMVWNLGDDSCRVLRFGIPALVSNDELTGFESRWTLMRRSGGRDSIISSGVFRSRYASGSGTGFSAILNADVSGGTVCLGGDAVSETVAVDFDCMNPGGIGYRCDGSLAEINNRILFRSVPAREYSRMADLAELKEHISSSQDPFEGIWEYMDRENDPAKAVPGAAYILATVSDGRGGYEIVNLSEPGMVLKGRMKPTRFASNFDLRWRDRSGRDAGPECYAAYEIENLTLRFYFPLLGASMRFRRLDSLPQF